MEGRGFRTESVEDDGNLVGGGPLYRVGEVYSNLGSLYTVLRSDLLKDKDLDFHKHPMLVL